MNKLKELRDERGLSTRVLENMIGIHHVVITNYENEKRDMSTTILKRFSNFFEVSIDYLLCHSSYCVYALYKEGNFYFGIRADYYNELKEKKYIYFDNNNHRCIDINSLIGVGSTNNILELIQEFVRIEKMDALFDKKIVTDADIKALDNEITEIELTRGLVEKIKEALR
ncbi:MAG: helix-turn-helix transcriptional regulator [Acholeplasmatales bacterium]|nr:helix-turn-helix transcriptional regulator [Acholeplasmatales bacterium]MBR6288584.1 helix-turn-helix transcriptional regulator [Acholeplasmatales bacterium]